MLLFLLCAAANDDYVALKALYESTGGSAWTDNYGWDMSNTDACGWGDVATQPATCDPSAAAWKTARACFRTGS